MREGLKEVCNQIPIDIPLTLERFLESPSIRQFWRAQCAPFEAVFGRLELDFRHHLRVIEHSSQAEQLNLIQKGNRDADEERQRIRQKEKGKLYCFYVTNTFPSLKASGCSERKKILSKLDFQTRL